MSATNEQHADATGKKRLPMLIIGPVLLLLVLSWVPLVLLVRARVTTSTEPRVQFMQDMGIQPKYREQQTSEVFADGRADRPRIVDTVARGQLQADDHFDRGFSQSFNATTGKVETKFINGLPNRPETQLNGAFLKRGQQRFNSYCAPCHGQDGYGNGAVAVRALELQTPTWVPPSNLHSDNVRARTDGHMYNTINNGIRNMPGYGTQIPVEDRWAIVAYVRALQLSQGARPADVPAAKLPTLR